jgi:hypothetical protein
VTFTNTRLLKALASAAILTSPMQGSPMEFFSTFCPPFSHADNLAFQ